MTTFGDEIDWGQEARRAVAQDPVGAPLSCPMLEEIRAALRSPAGRPRIVDCGCNIGQFYPMFEAAGFEYVGLDQSTEALDIARRRWPRAQFLQCFLWDDWSGALANAALAGGIADESARHSVRFEVALCNAVLQHNTYPEKERILPRIAAAVLPGGLFAMQESTVLQETRTQLRQDQWIALVERHGFKLLKTWHRNELGVEDGYLFRRV
jgi:SAM-dependent methyltransferase